MITPITQSRWQEAQQDKQIIEVGGGAFPAVSFCLTKAALVVEPLWFVSLKEMESEGWIQWVSTPFEDWKLKIVCDEIWIFNCLQHVRDPEMVITKAKATSGVIRFFEPVDYPTCVYHPHTFTQDDFVRWFGSSVKRYTDRLLGFFDADCCYGTWRAT